MGLFCCEAKKQRTMLNSSDRLFAELRDASFAAVGPRLGEKAKLIQSSYQGSKVRLPQWGSRHTHGNGPPSGVTAVSAWHHTGSWG